jgi:AraC-like DNA-binding protein
MTRRIERAKALLRVGEMSVTDVCLAVGCASLGSFSARFTEVVGMTPTAYRSGDHSALASVPGCIAKDLTRPKRELRRSGAPDLGVAGREQSRIEEAGEALAA